MKRKGLLRIFALALTLSLLILAIPATPALAATGTISISPSTGPPGTTVTLTALNFTASTTYTVTFSGTYGIYYPTSGSTGTGNFTAYFSVPPYPRGVYSVTVTTTSDTTLTPASFTITPLVTLSSASGYVGDSITVTGTGFYTGSAVTVYFDTTTVWFTTTALANGTFSVLATVPASVRGTHTVQGYDVYGYSSAASFITYSKITVTPASGGVGDNITISGTGFAASQSIAITFDGVAVTTTPAAVTTSTVGSFSQASFTVPAGVRGSHTIRAQDISGNYATATFTTTQSITLTPTSGPNGTKVTVKGTGFLASATITLYFDDVPVTTTLAVVPTDTTGAFSTSFDIPSSSGGAHQVKASDGTNTDTETFTVTAALSISPTSGYVGMKVTVNGTGFLASKSDVTILFNNVLVKTTSTNAKGVLSTTFDVPAQAAGTYTIKVSDGTNVKDADFTVTTSATISPVTTTASPGHVGDNITVSGVGFMAGSTLTITYDNTTEASTTVASDGTFSVTFPAPASLKGAHTVTASDNVSSIPLTFVMESTPPAVPALSKPEAGTKAKSQATFDWAAVSDPSGVTYTLQIATDTEFTELVLEKELLTEPAYTLTKSEKLESVSQETPYYWRVKAIDGASNESAWSDAGSFYVGFFLSQQTIIYIIIGIGAVILILLAFWLGQRRAIRSA